MGRLLLVFLAVLLPDAAAQVPFDACRDREDRVIPGVVDDSAAYAGLATIREGKPVIVWNAAANRHLSDTEQIFVYLHECAHHRLGHLYMRGDDRRSEAEADCWAIQLMVDGGMIRGRHLARLERSRRTVPGDETHLGGEAHVWSLRRCLELRTDRKAWAAALDTLVRAAADGFVASRGRALDSLAAVPVYESQHGTPGTYDCEVIGAAVRCLVFASREPEPAAERYARLTALLREWLPLGWTSTERRDSAGSARLFLAQDGMTGTLVSLARNGARVHFLVKQGAP
jgi:hypothetical protein